MSEPAGTRHPQWVGVGIARALLALLVVLVVVFVMSTVPGVRDGTGFDVRFDGWLQGSAYVVAGLVAFARPVVSRTHRRLWALVAAAMVLRATGFVVFLGYVRLQTPVDYPSVADLCWILSGLLMLGMVAELVHLQARKVTLLVLLDGIVAALAVSGLTLALLHDTLARLRAPGVPASVELTNLAYPSIDVALLVASLAVLVTSRWSPAPATTALVAGVVGFAVVDTVFLKQATDGTYRPGTWVAALSLTATALIAVAAWLPERRGVRAQDDARPSVAAPILFAGVCVVTLVDAAVDRFPSGPALLLSSGGLVLVIVRGVLTLTRERGTADAALAAKQAELFRFRALVETSDDFVGMATLDGRMLYLNPAGREMVGMPEDRDASTLTVVDLLTPESGAGWQARRDAVLSRGIVHAESFLRDLRGGPAIPVSQSTFLIRDRASGEPLVLASVQRDIRQRLAMEASLRELAEQRQALVDRLVQAQEEERARIAADVHDDSVQALAAVELRLARLHQMMLRGEGGSDSVALREQVEVVVGTVQAATGRLRELLFDLETPALEGRFVDVLDELAEHVLEPARLPYVVREGDPETGSETGSDAGAQAGAGWDDGISRWTRIAAYRVVKEALANVRNHAEAAHVTITLRSGAGEAGGELEIEVRDDGKGFDPATTTTQRGHLGLTSMRDRAAALGGTVTVHSAPGAGTTVCLRLPAVARRP